MLRPYASNMRFVQTGVLLVGAAMYALVVAYALQPINAADGWLTEGNNALLVFGAWNLLLVVVFIFAIVDAVRKVRAKKTRELGTGAMVVKLASIPYFVLNFIALAFLSVEGAVLVFFTAGLILVAVGVGTVLTYLTMTSTSVYGWAAIAEMRRERKINRALTVVYTILLLGFFTDVAAGVMLFGHSRRRPRLTLIVMLLVIGAALIALGFLGIFTVPVVAHSLDLPEAFYSLGAISIVMLVLGIAVIAGAVVGSAVLRSTLRAEARQAALARAGRDEYDSTSHGLVADQQSVTQEAS
jgi:hypothetical protein